VFRACCIPIASFVLAFAAAAPAQTIVYPSDAPSKVTLAAKEIRRYVYLRTGKLLPVAEAGQGITLKIDPSLGADEYRIKSDVITGGSDLGVLYGAYRYAELLGVRFYLHGDVIPDERLKELPVVNDAGKPLFAMRGILPFHDFPEGPDWWNQDDYLAYVSQLAKMRMNFMGMHCYPEGGAGPELLVWIGLPNDLMRTGGVAASYSAYWKNTGLWDGFNYARMKTGEFSGGASLLFPGDDYGPDMMAGLMPRPKTPKECNDAFNRVAEQMRVVFAEAKSLGVKTCIGTETPLTIPATVAERLKHLGKTPNDINTIREMYSGMFKHIAQAMPVDYYWLWTPEGWAWSGNNPQQFEATKRDIQAALDALRDLGDPFTLGTCGWMLGPAHDRAALDEFLPKSSPISCINHYLGHDSVEPAFANVVGRPKWAIPWMENDPEMTQPQLWAARMRYDAVDARRFGCTGLLGIHWRVKAMAPNVAALAAAAWDQSWVPANFDTKPVKSTRGSEGAIGGGVASFTARVGGAGEQAVYQTVRYGLSGYMLNIPDGKYTVTLQFTEPVYTEAGKRVFGAKIQGKQVVEHLDVFARVGQNKALDLSHPDVAVTNGALHIEFTKEIEFPCIAGIIISGKTKAMNQLASESFTRKINCGGAAVNDYETDRVRGGTVAAAPRHRAMPIEDFYVDFARVNFGDNVAEAAGKILASIDGVHLPQVTDWKGGPGNLVANGEPWSDVRKKFAFVDEFAALRPQIQGAGNLERFDYWLNTFRGLSAMAEANCGRGKLDTLMGAKKYEEALAARIELAQVWTKLMTLQTSIVSTPGELGTIANLEQHTRRQAHFVEGQDAELIKGLGKPLPPEAQVGNTYDGPAKIIVPTVRTSVRQGETLKLTVIVLDKELPQIAALHFRAMGHGGWQERPLTHVGRAVHAVTLPELRETMEYYFTATTTTGQQLRWPATAPQLNQTVIIIPLSRLSKTPNRLSESVYKGNEHSLYWEHDE
jgi:hypothetical protein